VHSLGPSAAHGRPEPSVKLDIRVLNETDDAIDFGE
jgi:hypothetical protein